MKRIEKIKEGEEEKEMKIWEIVEGKCGIKGSEIFREIGKDVGIGGMEVRRKKFKIGIEVKWVFMNGMERLDEEGEEIGINEMIEEMKGKRKRIGFMWWWEEEGDGKNDGVEIRKESEFNSLLRVVEVRKIEVIGERREGKDWENGEDIDDMMREEKNFWEGMGEVKIIIVEMEVIEREKECELMLRRNFVGKRKGVK